MTGSRDYLASVCLAAALAIAKQQATSSVFRSSTMLASFMRVVRAVQPLVERLGGEFSD